MDSVDGRGGSLQQRSHHLPYHSHLTQCVYCNIQMSGIPLEQQPVDRAAALPPAPRHLMAHTPHSQKASRPLGSPEHTLLSRAARRSHAAATCGRELRQPWGARRKAGARWRPGRISLVHRCLERQAQGGDRAGQRPRGVIPPGTFANTI